MIFNRIVINYMGNQRVIDFKEKNIIFSSNNSVGKSTILRMLFWGLGYNIPGTYKIKFDKIDVMVFFSLNGDNFYTHRQNKKIILYKNKEEIDSYDFKGSNYYWLSNLWQINSLYAVQNILGAIYMDQDKGWTLLNRGKVIGGINFRARDLLIGLQDDEIDPKDHMKKLSRTERTLNQVKQLLKISDISSNESTKRDKSTESNEKYLNLKLKKASLKSELNELKNQIKSESGVKDYITSSNIIIEHNGEKIPVTKDNILNYDDNLKYLKISSDMIKSEIDGIDYEIFQIQESFKENVSSLFKEDDLLQNTVNEISKVPINIPFLEAKRAELQSSVNQINEDIDKDFLERNHIVDEAEEWIYRFADILDITDAIAGKNYIFTKDIKSISGTIYFKLVFCFKMAYIKVIENHLNINLPIVLDSPSGREVTDRNIDAVIGILNDFFPNNQVIISSIYKYKIPNVNIIEINHSIFNDY